MCAAGANATFAPEHLGALEADVVLVSGYLPRPTIEAALARAQAPWVALDAAKLTDLPAGGNVLLANEEAATALGVDTDAPLVPSYDVVVVTRGGRGAVASAQAQVIHAEPPTLLDRNPPGIGDAFAASLLVSLARGDDVDRAVANACAVGSDAANWTWPG